jgi:predicted AAA+ superfamily ATPase
MIYPRNATRPILRAVSQSPVVLIGGPRQAGKSTLVKAIGKHLNIPYITLDDPVMLAATSNPQTFVADLPRKIIIDEIQRAPELFLPIKLSIDEDRAPGRFILTGSTTILTLPKLSESLAGRMLLTNLWSLSTGEIKSIKDNFVDWLFGNSNFRTGKLPGNQPALTWAQLCRAIAVGGYPEVQTGRSERDRLIWFRSYIQTIIDRDIRELAHIEGLKTLPNLLKMLAARTGQTMNYADLAREAGLPKTTIVRYVALFESTYLIISLPAWFSNLGKRLVKSPKIYFADTGVVSYLQGLNADRLIHDRSIAGFLFENFACCELMKQLSWSNTVADLYHFRTPDGHEVDFVLEGHNGKIVAIEAKCAQAIDQRDFKSLRYFRELAGKSFHRGIVLYTGDNVVSFDSNLHAVPISALWQLGTSKPYNIFV